MSYEITDEEVAKIEEICRREIGLHKNYSQRDILALISRLRAAEAKLNSICVDLSSVYAAEACCFRTNARVMHFSEVKQALIDAGVSFK